MSELSDLLGQIRCFECRKFFESDLSTASLMCLCKQCAVKVSKRDGSTNHEKPFEVGEVVQLRGEDMTVLNNQEVGGMVRLSDGTETFMEWVSWQCSGYEIPVRRRIK